MSSYPLTLRRSVTPSSGTLHQARRGFALLITIVLLAFLVLIAVSFASLTRVEIQIAANQQRLEKARQNALFGLQVAMGQLQKYAGPDQRVTARAELTASAINPYYTGVWNAAAAASAAGDARTRTATLEAAGKLNPVAPSVWLVSGNEASPTAVNYNTASAAMRQPVTLVKATGTGTLGQVVVPKVQLTSTQVPGYSGAQPIGNYAYWVGDEGVKAKLSVVDPYTPRPAVADSAAFTPTSLQTYYRGVSAQRFGLETVDDGTNAATLASLYNPTANTTESATLVRNLNKIINYPAAYFAGLDLATLRARFHDLTVHSNGLLTNTAGGGLRRDLSWHFAQPDATDGLDKTSLLYLTEQKLYAPGLYYSTANIPYSINPKWQALKAYYNTPITNAATNVVLTNPSNTTNGILPLVVQARVFFGCHSDAVTKYPYLDTYVAFVLANPYNVTLNVNPVRFKFTLRTGGTFNITVTPGSQAVVTKAVMGASPAPLSGSFLTPAFTMAPGKVKVFSLAGNPAAGTTDALLKDGLDINNAVSVQLSATAFTPSSSSKWNLTYAVSSDYTLSATDKATEDAALGSNNANVAAAMAALWGSGYVALPSMPGIATSMTNPWVAGGLTATLKMSSENGIPSTEQIRWLQDFNTRTSKQDRPIAPDYNALYKSLFWSTSTNFSSDLASGDPCWGTAVSDSLGKTPVILYNLPRPPSGAATGWPSLVSLGQLQHANLGTRAWQPSYIIANSYASLFTQRDQTVSTRVVPSGWTRDDLYYDLPYLLNEALWDNYYFSSVPQLAGTFNPYTDNLPNSRYFTRTRSDGVRPTQSELTADSYAAASRLLVNGSFNVNSTSVQAWRALFTSFRGLSYNSETNLSGPFPRSPYQTGASSSAQTVTNDNAWSGFRNLSTADIDNLATQMVNQVRLRGPFRSLADFVNRRLMSASADPNNLGLRGALQAAIDAAGLNDSFTDTVNATAYTGTYNGNTLYPTNVVGSRSLGAPGWLLQGDLLQGLGPILSARSDTFIIRTYGDSADPISTANGTPPPRVYCEAVVQRIPDYVDKANAADAATLTTTNTNFGRRFIITQFRWLTESDL